MWPDFSLRRVLTTQTKIVLDQYLSYLRHGLNTCYYCVVSTAFPEELQRKCVGHLRSPEETVTPEDTARDGEEEDAKDGEPAAVEGREADERAPREAPTKRYTYPSKTSDERWVENLDLKIRGVVDEDPDVVDFGGRDVEDETRRLMAPFIKQEEADKYRCKQCAKLFRAPEFVIKHIVSKHGEVVKDKLDEVSHIPPSKANKPDNYFQRFRAGPSTSPAVQHDARGRRRPAPEQAWNPPRL